MQHIMAIDQGTTGTTVLLVDIKTGAIVAKSNHEYRQIYPKPGMVEHDLNEIWESFKKSLDKCYSQSSLDKKHLKAIGITNQRETICFFKRDGSPIRTAIVWQDRRTEELCTAYKARNLGDKVKKITGLTLDPYFSGTKIHWVLKNDSTVQKALVANDLLIGNIDTYLLYRLTGGQSHKTDASNASRTMLMNLKNCEWDQEMMDILEVPKDILPTIEESIGKFGDTSNLGFIPDGVPISCMLGDQQAALFGQLGVKKGDAKCTYGTGAFLLRNTGEDIVYSEKGLLTTVAYKYKNKTYYALEGSSYIAGAAVQWMRDNIKAVQKSSEIESLAGSVDNLAQMEHLMFMPFFTGIGCPYWISNAKAAIVGITRDSELKHLAFACLEGIVLSINDIVKAFEEDTKSKTIELRVDGGAAANNLLMELQASASNMTIIRPKIIETTGYGAALGALVGIGEATIESLNTRWEQDRTFAPNKKYSAYFEKKITLWRQTIQRLFVSH